MESFASERVRGAVLGALAAAPMLVALRGFMVDDALVTARYAANLAAGGGYALNPGEPATDGVTPFGFAFLLAPFARGTSPVLAAFLTAKWLGAVAWLAGAMLLGVAVERLGGRGRRRLALLLVACSAPLGAWAASGMETGVVVGFAASAVACRALGRERWTLGLAGLAAAWRPEMVPWAIVLAAGHRASVDEGAADPDAVEQGATVNMVSPRTSPVPREVDGRASLARLGRILLVLAPVAAVAVVRLVVFGAPTPLSFRAKAPVLSLGVAYAGACVLLTGVLAMVAWRRLPAWARGVALAVVAHLGAIALAGGDWMPLARLAVPVLPGAFLVAAAALAVEPPWASALRLVVALAGESFAALKVGPSAAAVGDKRLRTLAQLGPSLAGRTVATVDAGWVGAAAARVVDLAGITDPAVAALPGGHTSKRIPSGFLDARGVDALVLLLAPGRSLEPALEGTHFARTTELHVVRLAGISEGFVPVAESEEPHYVVLVRRERRGGAE